MNLHDLPAPGTAAAPEVFQQLGLLTRQLHDALTQLGVMPKLQQSAEDLPDARSRLSYIARKTGEAADKVLTAVDLAKQEQAAIVATLRGASAGEGAALAGLAAAIEASTTRTDQHLTDIMLAQDFHDLTGQVIAKVMALAIDLEDSLVKLLIRAAPAEVGARAEPAALSGPAVEPRVDVVSSQREVDDLLASLGF